ncbi:hypothetical protein MOV08_40205 [Streptomyces yunnanensis]|uniref:DUF7144 domain-containing protein n=1 Tax=Streptomyces yunnanensis TaxID=156453 RepID=A0ABY8AIP5_9ACTN|nr:hypothetical protein [Streptomyces yunnanensis]WEB44903.1 hypothetical protein MOV08_40205 [Streptomyces yunnanensis]
MASAAGHPAGTPHPGYGGRTTAPQTADRHGLVMFAGVMLGLLALFNGLDGIAAIVNSHIFLGNVALVLGDMQAFGWLMLALAILQAAAAVGVLTKRSEAARWFGVAVLGLNAFAQMFFIPAYPVWSVMIIALDVLAIYGLCVYGGSTSATAEQEQGG